MEILSKFYRNSIEIQIASRPPPGPEKEPIGSMDVKKCGSICHQERVRYINMYQQICGIGHNIVKKVSDTSRYHQNDDRYSFKVAQGGDL